MTIWEKVHNEHYVYIYPKNKNTVTRISFKGKITQDINEMVDKIEANKLKEIPSKFKPVQMMKGEALAEQELHDMERNAGEDLFGMPLSCEGRKYVIAVQGRDGNKISSDIKDLMQEQMMKMPQKDTDKLLFCVNTINMLKDKHAKVCLMYESSFDLLLRESSVKKIEIDNKNGRDRGLS